MYPEGSSSALLSFLRNPKLHPPGPNPSPCVFPTEGLGWRGQLPHHRVLTLELVQEERAMPWGYSLGGRLQELALMVSRDENLGVPCCCWSLKEKYIWKTCVRTCVHVCVADYLVSLQVQKKKNQIFHGFWLNSDIVLPHLFFAYNFSHACTTTSTHTHFKLLQNHFYCLNLYYFKPLS